MRLYKTIHRTTMVHILKVNVIQKILSAIFSPFFTETGKGNPIVPLFLKKHERLFLRRYTVFVFPDPISIYVGVRIFV